MSLIEIQNLSKYFKVLNRREGLRGAFLDLFSGDYRTVKAVDDISFSIDEGEIVGYIGPNGAGKSTTIKMMTGILQPTSGKIEVNQLEPYSNRIANARRMGVVFGQRTQLWWDLPVIESFKILKEIYEVDNETFKQQMGLFEDLIEIKKLYPVQVRTLSLGQRMLCDIAAAFLHNPKVVFLDEPTIGLDVSVKAKIRDVIRELNHTQNITIILTTHDLGDIEALCQRIIIIDKGKILFDGPVQRVNQLFGVYRTLKAQIFDFNQETLPRLNALIQTKFPDPDAVHINQSEDFWTDLIINQEKAPLREVLNLIMSEFALEDIRIVEISMENVVQRIYDGALL
ncbi:MAG: ATP-binding cassette domain-containing protein [Anaerolineales bacterium]|nr:ATP-binding cassette domain-containing protein [Anaerolineales bacterium]